MAQHPANDEGKATCLARKILLTVTSIQIKRIAEDRDCTIGLEIIVFGRSTDSMVGSIMLLGRGAADIESMDALDWYRSTPS
jgi:hypothetical protein